MKDLGMAQSVESNLMRYFLPCPECGRAIHTRGGNDQGPIYYCANCGRLWALSVSKKHNLQRVLRQFFADSGNVAEELAALVPEDWSGEPCSIGIGPDEWEVVRNPQITGVAADLASEIAAGIRDGDVFYLLDYGGRATHRLELRNDQLVARPL
ncbi:MAG TPA: hypothetical protein VHR66_19615 [Gemmataceae bacterium]|nr:hypothetical protein [Gemmataceae bacterium]